MIVNDVKEEEKKAELILGKSLSKNAISLYFDAINITIFAALCFDKSFGLGFFL